MDADRDAYCRDIESYLCRKNDGHLIRVVGPSFDLVSGWATRGIPLKIVCAGIDRTFERSSRQGPRRRPVRIDFCEADVLDVFDEWRRAIGLPSSSAAAGNGEEPAGRRGPSLPGHLERAVMRLTSARASGALGPAFDALIDRVAGELDTARAQARGLRGEARESLLGRLELLDAELLRAARDAMGSDEQEALTREADEEIAAFRTRMTVDAFARARESAVDRLVRERYTLPVITFVP